jgi:transposase-like protein
MSRRRPPFDSGPPPCPECRAHNTIQVAVHLDERTFFCPACEHTWCVSGERTAQRGPFAVLRPAARENAPSPEGGHPARVHVLRVRLAETIRRAATLLETSRALHRVSRHRRQLRHLSRLALRPQ